MFPVDSLPPQYCEERDAAEQARRLAEQQRKAAEAAQTIAPVATHQASPSSLAQTLHAPLSRPGSSSVLGSIFQSFAKRAASTTPSPAASVAPSRTQTPVLQACDARQKADLEAMKRDTDICALPGWH